MKYIVLSICLFLFAGCVPQKPQALACECSSQIFYFGTSDNDSFKTNGIPVLNGVPLLDINLDSYTERCSDPADKVSILIDIKKNEVAIDGGRWQSWEFNDLTISLTSYNEGSYFKHIIDRVDKSYRSVNMNNFRSNEVLDFWGVLDNTYECKVVDIL